MEVVQYSKPHPFYGGTRQIQLHEVDVRTIQDNKMCIERNRARASLYDSNHEPSPRREHKRNVSKSSPQKLGWNGYETKRKRRVARYKLYEAEGKAKSSLKGGLRTFKLTCMKIIADF